MAPRYIVMDNVEHSCCYESCVRDTTQPTEYANKFALVCECRDAETANMIASILNKYEQPLEVK